MGIQYGRYFPMTSIGGAQYDVVRAAPPTPQVAPSLVEAGVLAWSDGDTVLVALSNGNIERYSVVAGVPVFRFVIVGARRFQGSPPPVANYRWATDETTFDGDIVEVWGAGPVSGYYEAVELEPGGAVWILRDRGVELQSIRVAMSAGMISTGVQLSGCPSSIWLTDVTNELPINNTTYTWDSGTCTLTLPVGVTEGQIIEITSLDRIGSATAAG